jgi:RNA polymerase sigma-70 factor (ECF subfamily)
VPPVPSPAVFSQIDRNPPVRAPAALMHQTTEEQLVTRVRAGDRGALGGLLERYQDRLFNVALRMLGHREDAAEVAQDAMLKIVEHIGEYHGDSAIGTWMTRIVMNLSISRLRQRRVRLTVSLDAPASGGASGAGGGGGAGPRGEDQGRALREQLVQQEPGPELSVQQKEMSSRLHEAMRLLDEELRAVLVLRDIEEMDYQQIAVAMTLPLGTVKSRLFRARLALRQIMLDTDGAMPRPAAKD